MRAGGALERRIQRSSAALARVIESNECDRGRQPSVTARTAWSAFDCRSRARSIRVAAGIDRDRGHRAL